MFPRALLPFWLGAFLVVTSAAEAEELEFDFKDPKGVNSLSFVLDSRFEPIMGVASGISGKVTFDPRSPRKTRGKIVVEARTLVVPNQRMVTKLLTESWLHVEKFPTIEFELGSVKRAKHDKKKNTYQLTVQGKLTCHGVTRDLETQVTATFLPGDAGKRIGRMKGDLLVLRTEFTIKRTDYKINPTMDTDVVADEIQVRLAIVGTRKVEG